nr:hypothetical protein [uncultured Dethiosulfovibrio sp.]
MALQVIVMTIQLTTVIPQLIILSEQLKVSREAMFFPMKDRAFWEWVEATEETEIFLQKYVEEKYKSKELFFNNIRDIIPKLTYKSSLASGFFESNIAEKIDQLTYPRVGVTDNLFLHINSFIVQAVNMYDNPTKEKKFTQGYDPRYIKLEMTRIKQEVIELVRERYKNNLQ